MFIKMWFHFVLYKKCWCNGKKFVLHYVGEDIKSLFLQLIYFILV